MVSIIQYSHKVDGTPTSLDPTRTASHSQHNSDETGKINGKKCLQMEQRISCTGPEMRYLQPSLIQGELFLFGGNSAVPLDEKAGYPLDLQCKT
jgi:hypothetical protein